MKRVLQFLAVLASVLVVLAIVGCLGGLISPEKDTPKARGYMAMRTYDTVKADYMDWTAYTDLTAEEVNFLNTKRKALVNGYKPINYYNTYVETGQLPTAEMERELIRLLDDLQRDAIRNANRRSVASQKSDQQILDDLKAAHLVEPDAQLSSETSRISAPIASLLIELIRAGIHSAAVLFEMKAMSVEEIDTAWDMNWTTFKAFDPQTLPVPQIGV